MEQKRVLFIAESVTLAHVCRLFVLAKRLLREGHAVYFAADPRMRKIFDFSLFHFMPIHSIPGDEFLERIETGKRLYRYDELEQYAREDLALIMQVEPHLVVGDLRVSLAVTSRAAGVPYWLITNAYWSPFSARTDLPVPEIRGLPLARIPGAGYLARMIQPLVLAFHLKPVNKLADLYGVKRFKNFRESFTFADRTFYADIPGLAACGHLPPGHSYLGQIKWSADVPAPEALAALPGGLRKIFINLGSSGPVRILEELLDSLPETEYCLIAATAGRINPPRGRKNTIIADYLPAEEMSRISDLVICNGGSPSAYLALSNGVPVIGIPSNLDQLLNMRNIVRRHAGIMIRASGFSGRRLREAVKSILNNQSFRISASAIAREFARYEPEEMFARAAGAFLKDDSEMPVDRAAV